MRRKDREITDFNEILEIIKAADCGHLAFNGEDYPYVIPINFGEAIDESGSLTIYFHGADDYGKKYDLMQADPRACFCLDCGRELRADPAARHYTMAYSSVIMYGKMSLCPDDEKMTALEAILRHYGIKGGIDPNSAALTRCFKLTVESCTAKRRK